MGLSSIRTWVFKVRYKLKDQEIAASKRRYLSYLANEDKSNGIIIIAKNDEISPAEYPGIFICEQHVNRRHKNRVLFACNKGSTLFADGNASNAIVTYNF